MITRIIAGTIVCFICFNAGSVKFYTSEAFMKATIASFVIGPILGFLSYKSTQKPSE